MSRSLHGPGRCRSRPGVSGWQSDILKSRLLNFLNKNSPLDGTIPHGLSRNARGRKSRTDSQQHAEAVSRACKCSAGTKGEGKAAGKGAEAPGREDVRWIQMEFWGTFSDSLSCEQVHEVSLSLSLSRSRSRSLAIALSLSLSRSLSLSLFLALALSRSRSFSLSLFLALALSRSRSFSLSLSLSLFLSLSLSFSALLVRQEVSEFRRAASDHRTSGVGGSVRAHARLVPVRIDRAMSKSDKARS